jgi:hypothetical protein
VRKGILAEPCADLAQKGELMAEDAFKRFRRLRGIVPPGSERAVIPCPEGVVTARALVTTLRQSGIVVRPWVDHVRLVTLPGTPCPALLQALIDVLERYEERVALAQYGAGLSPDAAEALAWQGLLAQEAQEDPQEGTCDRTSFALSN